MQFHRPFRNSRLLFTASVYFLSWKEKFPVPLSIGAFAVGAGFLSGILSVNERKDMVITASKIHGAGAVIGFMAFLFFPLLHGIVSFRQKDIPAGVISIGSFVLSLVFFACFVMGDKEQFQNTVLKLEGVWERLALFCMYIPFLYEAIGNLFS